MVLGKLLLGVRLRLLHRVRVEAVLPGGGVVCCGSGCGRCRCWSHLSAAIVLVVMVGVVGVGVRMRRRRSHGGRKLRVMGRRITTPGTGGGGGHWNVTGGEDGRHIGVVQLVNVVVHGGR